MPSLRYVFLFCYLMLPSLYADDAAPKKEVPAAETSTKDKKAVVFEWLELPECSIELLKPNDWYFEKTANLNGYTYFITPEDFSKTHIFKTGLSLVYIANLKASLGHYPSQQAEIFVDNAKKVNPQLNVKIATKEGFTCSSFKMDHTTGSEAITAHFFMIADDVKDIFYTFVFQYPQAQKETMSVICDQIFKNIKLSKIGF